MFTFNGAYVQNDLSIVFHRVTQYKDYRSKSGAHLPHGIKNATLVIFSKYIFFKIDLKAHLKVRFEYITAN